MTADWWMNALWSVVPTLIIGAMFGLVLYGVLNADRKVRTEREKAEREFGIEQQRRATQSSGAAQSPRATSAKPSQADVNDAVAPTKPTASNPLTSQDAPETDLQ